MTRRLISGPRRVVAYLIPDFPNQIHTWVWREIACLRGWGVEVSLYATRQPSAHDRARHAFAAQAEREATYLWPATPLSLAAGCLWAIWRHPLGLLRTMWLALTVPTQDRRLTMALIPRARLLARSLKHRDVSHLHVHFPANSAILAMMVRHVTGVTYSLTLNAGFEFWGEAMEEKLKDAKFVAVTSEWLLERVRNEFHRVNRNKTLLCRVGVDTEKWRPRSDDLVLKRPVRRRILTIGRLHKSKGHDVLLTAMQLLVKAGRDISLTVVGAGPERSMLEAQVLRDALDDRVTFLGSLSEEAIRDLFIGTDVFVLASHIEALGVVHLEAMSMGVPTIGTATGGVGEIIVNKVNGLLVPPGDPVALAEAIAMMLDHPDLCAKLINAGQKTVREQFDSRIGAATLFEQLFGHAPAS